MKKVLYTILSILSIIYIGFLIVDTVKARTAWDPAVLNPDVHWFGKIFDFVVRFGGIAIIFAFALVNFTGNPLKTVFFILLIVAIVAYIIVLATPDFFYNLFSKFGGSKEPAEAAISALRLLM